MQASTCQTEKLATVLQVESPNTSSGPSNIRSVNPYSYDYRTFTTVAYNVKKVECQLAMAVFAESAGEGLFSFNSHANGEPDRRTVHAGRPPTRGEKWVVSQFMRGRLTF